MMKAKAMKKLTVFGPKAHMKRVIEELYSLNAVHIEDYKRKSEEDFFDIGEPFENNERYSELLVMLRAMISNLGIKGMQEPTKEALESIDRKTKILYDQSTKLLKKKEYFENILKLYAKKRLEKLSSANIDFNEEMDKEGFVHYVGFMNSDESAVAEKISKVTSRFSISSTIFESLNLFGILAENKKKDKIEEILSEYDFSPIDNPVVKKNFELESKSGVKFIKLNNEEPLIEKKLKHLLVDIEEMKKENSKFLLQAENRLRIEAEKAEAPLRFATTDNTFTIRGWIPRENVGKLESRLDKVTGGKVMIKAEEPTKKDNVPVAFNHPKIIQPFESFMELYTLPSYKEIDPTFFLFLTFPFFFGFMLGDVGYGLITLTIFTLLKKKMPQAKNMLNAFIVASISAIIFGMIFGEYFGFEEVSPEIAHILGIHPHKLVAHGETEIVYPIPHLFSRSHGMSDLLSMSVLFGLTHIILGYIIALINIYKQHGLIHAIKEKFGWLLLMPITIWLLVDFLGLVSGFVEEFLRSLMLPMPISGGLAALGLILIVIGEGAGGAVEVPALLSNILSYARLMAVGMASLSLALVINNMAGDMFAGGVFGIIAGIIVLVLGHSINIALGILSPFLHSIRLHYVEFFTKFFKGGGRRFESFGQL